MREKIYGLLISDVPTTYIRKDTVDEKDERKKKDISFRQQWTVVDGSDGIGNGNRELIRL